MRMVRLMFLTAMLIAAVGLRASDTRPLDNYRSIIDRNPFGLKPVQAISEPTNAPPVADPKKQEFYLTGISTVGYPKHPKKAYLLNKDNSKKEYGEKYYNLILGEKSGDMRLDDIDEKGRRVQITYQGNQMWLSMKENGVPTPAGPPPGQPGQPGVPGAPGMAPGGAPQPPGAAPLPLPGAAPGGNAQPYPAANPNRRIPRSAGYNGNANPRAMINAGVPNMTTTPGVGNQTTLDGNQHAPQPEPIVDPVVQYINGKASESRGGPPFPTLTP